MASALGLKASTSLATGTGLRACRSLPVRPARVPVRSVKAQATQQDTAFQVAKNLSLSAVAASWALAGNAQAATELAQVAASDNRFGIIATLFVPALGWVGFNILQPAFNQLNRMGELSTAAAPKGNTAPKKRGTAALKKRSVAGAVGLGAALSMMAVQQADAAQEVMQLAANDNRFGIIATLFLPALGWVAFNILQPAQNQLVRMGELGAAPAPKASKRR